MAGFGSGFSEGFDIDDLTVTATTVLSRPVDFVLLENQVRHRGRVAEWSGAVRVRAEKAKGPRRVPDLGERMFRP